ncbi:hypothetical protein SFR_5696 [Streptomyces sp. FR-008]|nr:hypothetical protein SFR_5696 [Streptomyces sp. FR-008]
MGTGGSGGGAGVRPRGPAPPGAWGGAGWGFRGVSRVRRWGC